MEGCVGQLNFMSMLDTDKTLETSISKFKNHDVRASEVFDITTIDKHLAYAFVRNYHYLGNKDFVCSYAFGLWCCGELVGVATYSPPAGVQTLKGWFGIKNDDLSVVELTRLAMIPDLNGCNATSFLLSNSMRMLKKTGGIRAVISLADASRHVGSIYQVCNFKYFGLSNQKTDFYTYPDMRKNPFGVVSNLQGVYVQRTRKHRYAYVMDRHLKVLYEECKAPKQGEKMPIDCCGGDKRVFDRRFKTWYTCPVCTGRLDKIDIESED